MAAGGSSDRPRRRHDAAEQDEAGGLLTDAAVDPLAEQVGVAEVACVKDQRRRQAVRLAPVAERLLAVAARLLPASDRVRYAGEFGSELWEIAHAGGRRRAQLAYAARQVRSAWRLGRELQAPQRRAVP